MIKVSDRTAARSTSGNVKTSLPDVTPPTNLFTDNLLNLLV